FQAEDGIRDFHVTGVQTCALPISAARRDSPRARDAPQGDALRRGDVGAGPGGHRRGDQRHPQTRLRIQPDHADGHASNGLRSGYLGPHLLLLWWPHRGAGHAGRTLQQSTEGTDPAVSAGSEGSRVTVEFSDIWAARANITKGAVRSPLVPSPFMSRIAGHDFFLKLETAQPIGAFKIRGATNALVNLPEGTAGVTCC